MRFEKAAPGEVGMSGERLGWARDLLADHVASGRTPSAVAVLLRHGRVVFVEAFGAKEPGGPPLAADHMWPIASAGKPIVAATLLSLVEDGLVGMNDPVIEFIPELDPDVHGDVLVHHLLTHTTGWESAQRTQRMVSMLMDGRIGDPPPGRDAATHMFLSAALEPVVVAEPGVQQDYDTVTFELVSEIVRRVTGGSLDRAVRTRVFEPLGLERSALQVSEEHSRHIVHRAPHLPFGRDQVPSFEGRGFETSDFGGAGLFLSPLDLAVFGQMILQEGEYDGVRCLAPSTVRSMVTNQIPGVPALFADVVVPEGSWGHAFTVVGPRPYPYFVGGLMPRGTATHPGAGGVSYWIDFDHGVVGVFFEVITEISEHLEPVSGMAHRFQDVVLGAIES